jgi:hypothetical protein
VDAAVRWPSEWLMPPKRRIPTNNNVSSNMTTTHQYPHQCHTTTATAEHPTVLPLTSSSSSSRSSQSSLPSTTSSLSAAHSTRYGITTNTTAAMTTNHQPSSGTLASQGVLLPSLLTMVQVECDGSDSAAGSDNEEDHSDNSRPTKIPTRGRPPKYGTPQSSSSASSSSTKLIRRQPYQSDDDHDYGNDGNSSNSITKIINTNTINPASSIVSSVDGRKKHMRPIDDDDIPSIAANIVAARTSNNSNSNKSDPSSSSNSKGDHGIGNGKGEMILDTPTSSHGHVGWVPCVFCRHQCALGSVQERRLYKGSSAIRRCDPLMNGTDNDMAPLTTVGPYHIRVLKGPMYCHWTCARWSSEVRTHKSGLHHITTAILRVPTSICSICHTTGGTLSCRRRRCDQRFHYECARHAGVTFSVAGRAEGGGLRPCILCPLHATSIPAANTQKKKRKVTNSISSKPTQRNHVDDNTTNIDSGYNAELDHSDNTSNSSSSSNNKRKQRDITSSSTAKNRRREASIIQGDMSSSSRDTPHARHKLNPIANVDAGGSKRTINDDDNITTNNSGIVPLLESKSGVPSKRSIDPLQPAHHRHHSLHKRSSVSSSSLNNHRMNYNNDDNSDDDPIVKQEPLSPSRSSTPSLTSIHTTNSTNNFYQMSSPIPLTLSNATAAAPAAAPLRVDNISTSPGRVWQLQHQQQLTATFSQGDHHIPIIFLSFVMSCSTLFVITLVGMLAYHRFTIVTIILCIITIW